MNELDENPTQMYAEGFTSFSSDTLWLDEKLSVTFPVNFLATNEEGQVSDPDFLKILDKFSVWLEEREQVNLRVNIVYFVFQLLFDLVSHFFFYKRMST